MLGYVHILNFLTSVQSADFRLKSFFCLKILFDDFYIQNIHSQNLHNVMSLNYAQINLRRLDRTIFMGCHAIE